MALEQPVFKVGICTAAADLSAKQFYGVKVTATTAVNIMTVKGEAAFGILQNKPTINHSADVMLIGVSKVMVGTGNLAAGAFWEFDADGTAITAEASKAAQGVVLIGANAGELATVVIGCANGAKD